MAGEKGSSAVTLQPCEETIRACEEQLLRSHVEFVAVGKTDLTDEQLVNLLLSVFPQSYSACDRNLLTERVAKITPLRRRRDDATDEATSVANKRQKIDETLNASGKNVALSVSAASSSSVSDSTEVNQSEGDEIDGDRRELNENEDCGWKDGSGDNFPMFKHLYGSSAHNLMLEELKWEVILPLHQLKLLHHFEVEPTARILLHGPPGCGKTMLARAIANEAGVPFCEIPAADLVSGVSGEPEENIRELFSTAYAKAPSIVFIDEIDAMASKTKSLQKIVEPPIVKQLIACMNKPHRLIKPVTHDADSANSNSKTGHVLVIGATNKINALDPALRQWFDLEFAIAAPDEKARLDILSALTCNHKLEVGFDLAKISRCTLGFVAGDLVALVKEAGKVAINRTIDGRILQSNKEQSAEVHLKESYRQPFQDEDLENLSITMSDFLDAGYVVRPSSEMEGFCFSTKANAKWDDVIGLQLLKSELEQHIIKPIKFPEVYKELGDEVDLKTKFFLYGPAGCGKTLIVEALANEAGANFMHINARNLKKYGDQSGLVVRNLFRYARSRSPCILFFDQLDMITKKDSYLDKNQKLTRYNKDGGVWPDFRQLISELGVVEGGLHGVYVIGATNCIKVGEHFPLIRNQFDKILCFHLPTPKERGELLKFFARGKPIDADVDLVAVAKDDCWNYNATDMSNLMNEAAKAAINRGGGCSGPWTINDADFKIALDETINEVTHHEKKKFKRHYC